MLLFLNIDCVLDVPSDAAGPCGDGAAGVRRLEAVLLARPAWRVVITSERRYRLTLEHFRRFFDRAVQPRIVGTTRLYERRGPAVPRTREDEVADFLRDHGHEDAPWVALDDRPSEYPGAGERLVWCETFTAPAAARLDRVLHRRAAPVEL